MNAARGVVVVTVSDSTLDPPRRRALRRRGRQLYHSGEGVLLRSRSSPDLAPNV